MTRRADPGEEFAEAKARPSVIQDGQAAVVQSVMQLNLFSREEILAFERSDDEIACGDWKVGDIADGARARATGGAERLPDQVRDVGFAVLARGGRGLDEHGLQNRDTI